MSNKEQEWRREHKYYEMSRKEHSYATADDNLSYHKCLNCFQE